LPVVGILAGFVLIIYLLRKRFSIGISMLSGTTILIIFSGMSLEAIGRVLWNIISASANITLFFTILFVSILAEILSKTEGLDRMVSSLKALFPDVRFLVISLPALVGILSFPGGAIFSAPMVQSSGEAVSLSPLKKALSNVFYRHLFYLVNPVYSGMILMSEVSGLRIMDYILFNIGTLIVALVFSFWFIFQYRTDQNYDEVPVPDSEAPINQKSFDESNSTIHSFINKIIEVVRSFLPFLVIVAMFLSNIPLFIAILCGMVIALLNYLPRENWLSTLITRFRYIISGIKLPLLFGVVGVVVFQDFVVASNAVDTLAEGMTRVGVPLLLLAAALPYLVGMLTGNPWAVIATTVPLLMPALPEELKGAYLGVVFVSGLVGYLNSPLHLCFILSNEYFGLSWKDVVPKLHIMSMVMLVGSLITFFVVQL